jgi:DNA-binding MarR family transcriptional regulator
MLRKHEPSQTDEPVGLLVAAVRRRIKQTIGARLRGSGLSPQQFWILVAIQESAGLSLRQLGERRWMDAPTVSRVVAALVRKRLVRIGGDADDRRRRRLLLSPAGRALASRLLPLARAHRASLVRGLSPAEQRELRRLLRRLIANLESRT